MEDLHRTRNAVLLLDDSAADAALIRLVLEMAGLELDVATSPSRALALLEKRDYRAFLIDHWLGEFEGCDVLLQLRDLEIALPPTWVVSVSSEDELRHRVAANGADGFIAKGPVPEYAAALLRAVGAASPATSASAPGAPARRTT